MPAAVVHLGRRPQPALAPPPPSTPPLPHDDDRTGSSPTRDSPPALPFVATLEADLPSADRPEPVLVRPASQQGARPTSQPLAFR